MSAKKILVIGELNVDILLNHILGFPEVGKEILASNMSTVLGSSSAIFASNLASLGAKVSFCGTIGQDAYADIVLASLRKSQVATQFIHTVSEENTGATIILNYNQDRANITYCGAMDSLTSDLIPWQKISEFDHIHISNFFIQKGIRDDIIEIFKRIKGYGVTTSLDMQWDVEEKWDFDYKRGLQFIDIFLPNEAEILKLTKSKTLQQAIGKIQPYDGYLVIKQGIKGSRGIHKNEEVVCPAYHLKPFVDAIGAGDSFNAGFILKFLEEASLEECLDMGNKIGAISTTATGGTKAFENKKSIEKRLSQLH
ncbi:carbohydrate kinase family protein [Christiangramia fulva]|uniref:Carbohydrate kinase family protein n=1 Tax=Christiangramia fulva TaxID=2126553 RepID=A0A2R3ZA23_9FLAO|nr:carbohydrate kinase family protein [Christiangramia fulva]AVR47119.1 carbohydrate kinase family protein [Christiangramia fulva]